MFKENIGHLQTSLMDTKSWMNPSVKKKLEKSWAPVFYENVFCCIDETPFAVLYSDTGRPAFPINILLSLEFIKHMFNYSDDELIDSFYFNYQVNHALGIHTLGEMNLGEKTIYNFQARIYQHLIRHPKDESLIFQQFLSLTKRFADKAGISMAEQRMDTTMFMSNIKRASRMTLAYDVLMQAVEAIPEGMGNEALSQVTKPEFKTDTIYRTKPSNSESKLETLLDLCQQARDILSAIPDMQDSSALRILNRFLREQTYRNESTGQLKPIDSKSIAADSLQSVWDEDATYRRKGTKGQSGYVLSLAETCDKDNPFQLITDYQVEKNSASDASIIQDRLPEIHKNTGVKDLYVDGGFYSPTVLGKDITKQVNLHFTNLTGSKPSMKIDPTEYAMDEATQRIIRCPNGVTPIGSWVSKDQTIAHFPLEACRNCPLQNQCHNKEQKSNYIVRLSLKAIKTAQERQKVNECRRENTSKRAGIEGTNSALKRTHGMAKVRERGIIKCGVVAGYKVLGQNFKRFAAFMLRQIPRGVGWSDQVLMPRLNGNAASVI